MFVSVPILFTSYSGLYGGAERILLDVLGGVGEPAVLACPAGGLADRARARDVPVLTLPTRRIQARGTVRDRAAAPLRLGAHGREIRDLAIALGAPVVVAWGMRSAIAAAAGLAGLRDRPRLVFEHVDLLPPGPVGRAVRAAARRADAIVCLSGAIAEDLDPGGALAARIHVVRPGVVVPDAAPPPPPPGAPTALVLGALVPWKRPGLALEAVAGARASVPGLRAVVAGPPIGEDGAALLAALRARAAAPDLAGHVELSGALDDPAAALAAATCLLHAADREPYGMVLAEALAAGRPVIAPAGGGALEVLDPGCGRLYPPGDAAAAARALAEVAGDPDLAAAMGRAGWARARERLRLEPALERWRAAALGSDGPASAGAPRAGDGDASTAPRGPGAGGAATGRARDGRAAGGPLALVTVTHDSAADLRRLLASVSRHLPTARVVVVDSGSGDGSLAVARAWPGDAIVIDLGANEGFGRGSNRGVAALGESADVAVLVNPDVELVDASLESLAAELRRPGAPDRLLAPVVLHPDGRRQDSAQPAPATAIQALRALVPPAALPAPLRRRVEPFRSAAPRRVAWAVGCCVAGRTATLRRLGPFDERAFLYGEDLDLGLRAAAAGVETWFMPGARVVHREAHSSAGAFAGEPVDLLAGRRRAVVAERLGPRRAAVDDWLQMTTFADRIALRRVLGRDAARERAQLAATWRSRRAAKRAA